MTLPWVGVAPGAPYFVTEGGAPWTPVGANEAITWPGIDGLFRERDLARADAYLRGLAESGVTCLRLMLEYCHREHRYFERPAGHFAPNMVRLWDALFARCEALGLRILLTPFDTFWMWVRWARHPYNRANGGPCERRSQWLLCRGMREAIKARLTFAVERWGGSGALFAWDLWNEIHPAHAGERADVFDEFIAELSDHVRTLERRRYGRAHPQTVSLFGPELVWRPHLDLATPIFRHPALDFASVHLYERGSIDNPRDTVAAALATGRLVRDALGEIRDARPFLDTEHGPIHAFKDRRITFPEPFDDEYFRHMQWAHLASGGAGGGMRWPNRHPHVLTPGMRAAQRGLGRFAEHVEWPRFRRRNLNDAVRVDGAGLAPFACGDDAQAIVWLLRTDTIGRDGRLRADAPPRCATVAVPGLAPGRYRVMAWDTEAGVAASTCEIRHDGDVLALPALPVARDLALAIRRVDGVHRTVTPAAA